MKNIEGASYCVHCNPHPLLEVAGTFEDHPFDSMVLLEPKRDTEAVEILDVAAQTVRTINRGTQT
jgi:hypothetical protein